MVTWINYKVLNCFHSTLAYSDPLLLPSTTLLQHQLNNCPITQIIIRQSITVLEEHSVVRHLLLGRWHSRLLQNLRLDHSHRFGWRQCHRHHLSIQSPLGFLRVVRHLHVHSHRTTSIAGQELCLGQEIVLCPCLLIRRLVIVSLLLLLLWRRSHVRHWGTWRESWIHHLLMRMRMATHEGHLERWHHWWRTHRHHHHWWHALLRGLSTRWSMLVHNCERRELNYSNELPIQSQ